MGIIAYYCVLNMRKKPEMSASVRYFDISQIFLFFGVAVFDFEGNGTVINIYASMKEP